MCILNKECKWLGTEKIGPRARWCTFFWTVTKTVSSVLSTQQQNILECFFIHLETNDIIHQVKNITWLDVYNNFAKAFHCHSTIAKLHKRLEDCLQICPVSKFTNRKMKTKVHSSNSAIYWWIVHTWDPARLFLKKYVPHMWSRNRLHLSSTFARLIHPSLPGLP